MGKKRVGKLTAQSGGDMTRARITRLHTASGEVRAGLAGSPFQWSESERKRNEPILAAAGVELLSQTAIEKRGHVLRRGARPVGTAYFGAPIQRYTPLYVLHVQTRPKSEASTKGATSR